jgi:EcsC protein family
MVPLNEYEARQADEIAEWKSERPSLVMAAFRGMSRPLSRLASKVIPRETIRSILDRAEAMSQKLDGREEIARKAGVSDVRELWNRPLEECDRLAASISAPAERLALVDGAVAGIGGVVTETLNVPLLLAATLRSIVRIGHSYGYTLDSEIDRLFVLGILELSTADEPERRQELFQQLEQLGSAPAGTNGRPKKKRVDLDGVRTAMLEDLAFGAVPILGDLTSILMDYDFVRRVDITARRVFQERWLKDHGKLEKIYPAPVRRRRSSVDGVVDLLAQLTYVGSYGVAFGVTLPLAFVARKAAAFDGAMVRGFKQGAADAAGDADRFVSDVRAGAKSAPAAAPGASASGLSVFPVA